MSDVPWRSDEVLEPGRVASILGALDATFRDANVRPVAGGWDFDTFCVDGEWYFRFPRRDEVAAALRQEWRVLDALGSIEIPYVTPDHVYRVEPSEHYGRPYCGYRRCPGVPLALEAPPCRADLGEFLEFLDRLGRLEVELPRPPAVGFGSWQRYGLERLERLGDNLDPALIQDARALIELGARTSDEVGFIHDDIGADHLLVGDGGSVLSVIDWTDAGYGDPASDWGGAVLVWGFEPVRSAGVDRTDAFWSRVRLRTVLGAVAMLWFGACESRPEYLRWGAFALETAL